MTPPKPYHQDPAATLYQGDALNVLQHLPDQSVDAVITDPPYSSGGMFRSDKNQAPEDKYQTDGTHRQYATFSGDNKDQRAWLTWCRLWLAECWRVTKDKSYLVQFTDWRMLPTTTDAIQCAGYIWRGIAAWDKTEGSRAPHKGYFRHQCEYIVWGTRGGCAKATHAGPYPGCFRYPVKQSDKHHMTGKPTPLMARLVEIVPEGGLILDPFAGSGTTLVAATRRARRSIGIENEPTNCQITASRLQALREATANELH